MKIRKEYGNNGEEIISMINNRRGKSFSITKDRFEDLSVSFRYVEPDSDSIFHETFEIPKRKNVVCRTITEFFSNYGKDIAVFDTYGASLSLYSIPGYYVFSIVGECNLARESIKANLGTVGMTEDESEENKLVKKLFNVLDEKAKNEAASLAKRKIRVGKIVPATS